MVMIALSQDRKDEIFVISYQHLLDESLYTRTSPVRYDFLIGVLGIGENETKRSADRSSHIMIPIIQIEGRKKRNKCRQTCSIHFLLMIIIAVE